MKQALTEALQRAAAAVVAELGGEGSVDVVLTRPKAKEHGDYACSVAMAIASQLKSNPRQVAQRILALAVWPKDVAGAEIAGPGFINIRLAAASESDVVRRLLAEGERFGRIAAGIDAESVCVEFVSANPTGPMHVGHGRGAVVGDALARILAAQGRRVHREYYINDAGAQIGVLAESVWLRMQELCGRDIDFPDRAYPGEYIIDIARELLAQRTLAEYEALGEERRRAEIGMQAVAANMRTIRGDLNTLEIDFDLFFSELQLHESGRIRELIEKLQQGGLVYSGTLPPPKGKEVEEYEPVEQLLFRTTDFGDDVDRPLAKQDGTPTYFAADIAYHADKHHRGFDRQIDVWGADHGGYITRVQSAMKALTGKDDQPEVILVQMVNLTRDGKPVRMSKRAGTFVTLREVVDEVGSDAVRFNFLTRRVESQLDFDLEVAKQKSDENPVFYVQYAHARVCSILGKTVEAGIEAVDAAAVDLALLASDEEKALIAGMLAYPEVAAQAAERREPYRVATFLMRFAADFHGFYHKQRVICDDPALTQARLLLVRAAGQLLRNGLGLLGVSSPERM